MRLWDLMFIVAIGFLYLVIFFSDMKIPRFKLFGNQESINVIRPTTK